MKPTIYRSKRTYTQPQEPFEVDFSQKIQLCPPKQITVKDIKFDFDERVQHQSRRKFAQNYFMLNDKKVRVNRPQKMQLNRINPSSRLPALASQSSIPFEEQLNVTQKHKKNVTLLNAMIEILKPGEPTPSTKEINAPKLKLSENGLKLEYDKKSRGNQDSLMSQFNEILSQNSTKNYRGPRIIQNQITKLTNQNNIIRRKIASEEKSRPKYNDEEKREKIRKQNQAMNSFDGIQILTFSNKFPGLSANKEKKERLDKQSFDMNEFMHMNKR